MEGSTSTAAAAPQSSNTTAPQDTGSKQPSNDSAVSFSAGKQETKQQTPQDDWSEENDKSLADLLARKSKRDPAFRLRHKGEEKSIESLEDLKIAILDAQRGRGASKLVEEAKKEREAVAQQKAQLDAIREAMASGNPDDVEAAMQALAGERAQDVARLISERAKQREEQLSELTPRERQLLERNQRLEQEMQRRMDEEAQFKQQQLERQQQQQLESIRSEAKAQTIDLLKSLNLPEEKLEVMGPHIVRAMREAAELGQQIGRDIPLEAIKAQANHYAVESTRGVFEGLTPAQQYGFLGEKAVTGLVREFLQRKGKTNIQQSAQQQQQAQNQEPTKQEGPRFGTPEYFKQL